MKFKAILFDLDGTLLDTLEDLADSMNQALSELGFAAHPVEAYKYFVGDGAETMARRALPQENRDEATVRQCHQRAKLCYSKHWADKTRLYPGIAELLEGLQELGAAMSILSNKPDEFTQQMVAKLLAGYDFKIVRGANSDTPIKPDPTAALQIAEQTNIPPAEFVYLGDTDTDMKTANAAGMLAVGAVWGFRTAKELTENGAKVLVRNPVEVLGLFTDD
jgi:phosphoglycolate phosphatase